MQVTKKYSQTPSAEKAEGLIKWLDEKKAKDVVKLNIHEKNSCADIMLVATVNSERQARSLADDCLEYCKEHNYEFLGMEGYTEGSWVLIDMNDIIIHLFLAQIRDLYDLESLWREVPNKKVLTEE